MEGQESTCGGRDEGHSYGDLDKRGCTLISPEKEEGCRNRHSEVRDRRKVTGTYN